MICPHCKSDDTIKRGNRDGKQRYRCNTCKTWFSEKQYNSKAKILLFDIETTPLLVHTWNLYPKFIPIGQIVEDWNIICWSAKWLYDDEVLSACQTPEEAVNRDDKRVTKELWKLLDEADILIAHNLVDFDLKKANSKFLLHGLIPPSPFQMIDTLKIARSQFKMTSNKLDYLCKILGLNVKLPTTFDLWKGCLAGDPKSLNKMSTYCNQDTSILEDLYLKLRPWIKSHPNIALYYENTENRCGNCGSENINAITKKYYTPAGKYQVYRCLDCNSLTRSRQADKREKQLNRSLAR